MKINNYKTKYNLEDIVYLIYDNKIRRAVITGIEVKFTEELASSGYKILDIIKHAKNFFSDHVEKVRVYYKINISDSEGKFYCCPGGYFNDDELYSSTEKLLENSIR